jgi:predicted dehydrogenase
MTHYRVAIIGLGAMGHHHAEAVNAQESCELVGGAEINSDNAQSWHDHFGAAVHDDFERMLDETKPDIVVISTQAPQHHASVVAAAKRGIHVFCEKPIALDLVQADEMVDACDHYNVRFAINHIKRGSPYNQHVLERIAAGHIGQLVRLRAFDKGGRLAGNSLMEIGTHLYDWTRLFGGNVEWVHSHLVQVDGRESTGSDIKHTQEVNPRDRDAGLVLGERCFTQVRFSSGVHAEIEFIAQEEVNNANYGIDLIGTEGRIALRGTVGTTMFIHEGSHHPPDEPWQRVGLDAEDLDETGARRDGQSIRLLLQRRMLSDLIEAIETGREPFASGRDGRDCLEMIQATWESHRLGRRVSMPLSPREHPLERWRRDGIG